MVNHPTTNVRARIVHTTPDTPQVRPLNGGKTYMVVSPGSVAREWELSGEANEAGVTIDWTFAAGVAPHASGRHIHNVAAGIDVPAQVDRTTTSYQQVDNVGNVTYGQSQAFAADGTKGSFTQVVSAYDTHTTYPLWRLGELRKQQTTSYEPGSVTAADPSVHPPQATRTVEHTYTALGQLLTITTEPQAALQPTEPVDPRLNHTTTFAYDNLGLLTSTTASTARAVDVPRVTHIEYAKPCWALLDGSSACAPDERIFPSQVWANHEQPEPVCANGLCRPSGWTLTHPAYGVPLATMDRNGVQTTMRYDALGRPYTVSPQEGEPIRFSYAGRHDAYTPHCQTCFNGLQRTIEVMHPAAPDQVLRHATVSSGALGQELRTEATDFQGRLVATMTTYDALGRTQSVSMPFVPGNVAHGQPEVTAYTFYDYDSLGRVLQVKLPDLSYITHSYPSLFETRTSAPGTSSGTTPPRQESRVLTDIDGRMILSANTVMQQGELTEVQTTYAYAPFGLVKAVTDEVGHTTAMTYDRLGRRLTLHEPDRGLTHTTYTPFGQIDTETHDQPDGQADAVHTYHYDDLGRVTAVDTPDGLVTFTWDTRPHGIGQLAATASPFGIHTTYHYDALGRPVGTHYTDLDPDPSVPNEPAKTYQTVLSYESQSGRPLTLAYPEAPGRHRFTLLSQYNAHGLLQEIGEQAAAGGSYQMFQRIEARDLFAVHDTLGNGVRLIQQFDPLTGRLKSSQAWNLATEANLLSLLYAYHPNGLVKERSIRNPSHQRKETFDYDALQRLTGWQLQHKPTDTGAAGPWTTTPATAYVYDPIGNMLEVRKGQDWVEKYGYGTVSPTTPAGIVSQPHTLTTREQKGSSGRIVTTHYGYDGRGRQISGAGRTLRYTAFDLPKSLIQDRQEWQFAYDALGNRVKKRNRENTVSTFYLPGLYEERRQVGQPTTHVFHVGVAEVRYTETAGVPGAQAVTYTLRDALGSVSLLLDGTGQAGTPRYYEPFGQRIDVNGTPATTPLGPVTTGFTGHESDEESGLINMHGRLYDPVIRRFMSVDPIVGAPGFSQAWNPYSYVMNNPLNLIDPSGFAPACPKGGVVGKLKAGESCTFKNTAGNEVTVECQGKDCASVKLVPTATKQGGAVVTAVAAADDTGRSGANVSVDGRRVDDANGANKHSTDLSRLNRAALDARQRSNARAGQQEREKALERRDLPQEVTEESGGVIRVPTPEEEMYWFRKHLKDYLRQVPLVGNLVRDDRGPEFECYTREQCADQAIVRLGTQVLLTPVPGKPNATALGEEIGASVTHQLTGKTAAITSRITALGLSQRDAAEAGRSAFVNGMKLRAFVDVSGDDIVVSGIARGTNKPVLIALPDGRLVSGSAEVKVIDGTPRVFQVKPDL